MWTACHLQGCPKIVKNRLCFNGGVVYRGLDSLIEKKCCIYIYVCVCVCVHVCVYNIIVIIEK